MPSIRWSVSPRLLAVFLLTTFLLMTCLVRITWADTIIVQPGHSVQDAIDTATIGDRIELLAGQYIGNIDFTGKALEIVGVGPDSRIVGDGSGPVVRITTGEGPSSVLDSVTVTRGVADRGGAILISNASPTIVRNALIDNSARFRGSAIFVQGSIAEPLIANNLIAYSDRVGTGDPHAIQVQDSSPFILNNTIVRADSNAIFLSGTGSAIVMNNILARNGARGSKTISRRGRGICNFTSGATIVFNTFWRNTKSALLQGARDFRRIRGAERFFEIPGLSGNTDRSPRFLRRRLARDPEDMSILDFELRPESHAINAGNPDPAYNNIDGTRNTMGHLGGPLALN